MENIEYMDSDRSSAKCVIPFYVRPQRTEWTGFWTPTSRRGHSTLGRVGQSPMIYYCVISDQVYTNEER